MLLHPKRETKEGVVKVKHSIAVVLLAVAPVLTVAPAAQAARRVVVHRGPRVTRVRVTTHAGFPIRRTLPTVVIRPAPLVRVAPRVYLAPVVFGAAVVASLPATRDWSGAETLTRDEGWTDFTMNVDARGDRLLLEIDRGAAQVSFAEVVFENGETQVVDFNDHTHRTGIYSLLDFHDGRKVDHVRVVAKADTEESVIRLHLVG
jgi:hypothetical protein